MESEEDHGPVVEAVLDNLHWQEAFSGPPPPEPTPPQLVHIVKWKRETLYSISLWYTGSGRNWKRLAAANPDINARRIHIGEKIFIPEALLKRRRPLPADFLEPVPVRKSITPSKNSKVLFPKASDIPLYGPVESDAPSKTNVGSDLPVPLETID